MSTLRRDKSFRGNSSGVTVVELVVVVMILGLVVVLIATPLQMTSQLSKTSLDRLVEAVDTNLSIRLLTQQISSSQITRSKALQCGGQSAAFQTSGRARIYLRPGSQDRFTLPYSSLSSLGGISQTGEAVHVSDANLYRVNDFVVLISAENSENIGLFQVASKNDATSSLFLREAKISAPGSDCTFVKSQTLAEFKNAASARGERSVFVQRFHLAVYQVEGSNINMKIYPQVSDSGAGTSIFTDFKSFDIQTYWQEGQATDPTNEIEGTFTAVAKVELLEREVNPVLDSQCRGQSERALDAGTFCRKDLAWRIRPVNVFGRYVLSSSKRLNPKVQTNAVPKANLFPTCYLLAQPLGVAYDIPQGLNFPPAAMSGKNYRLFEVSGAVSEAALQMVNLGVTATGPAGGAVYCLNHNEFPSLKSPDPRKRIQPKDVTVYASSFALTGTSRSLDRMICAVAGRAEFSGVLSYYDPGMSRNASVTCREAVGVDASDDTVYDYWGGKKMTCMQVGSCSRVPVIYDPKTNRVKQDFLYQLECAWNDGVKRDCCIDPKDSTKKMTEITFNITSVKMKDPTPLKVTCDR